MKFKILAEVTIEEDSPLMPVTCDEDEKAKEGENVIKDVVKDLLYDMDDIEIKTIKVIKV